ncbi:hypothetical protein SAMN05216344_104171 [Polaromonas sp. OV174]|uniref:hypothetical protein n=1 Tax=Polaromonas sp. OV174 TaxID=1855300 RepID=UPI0008E506BB|nr:hypothetical protein [Polaromonas sp. OV174]SFB85798.1 hypothetical protein SAMN05216344_104171 [Polaromonas sp. OV174]
MSSFNYSTEHAGLNRMTSGMGVIGQFYRSISGARALSTLMLSALAAAILVVAYEVMDSVAEGHLLVLWVAMWAVAFVILALFAGSARQMAQRLKKGLNDWSLSLAEARSDQRLWAIAKRDERVMADLQMAMSREEARLEEAQAAATAPAQRAVKLGSSMLRAYQRNYI